MGSGHKTMLPDAPKSSRSAARDVPSLAPRSAPGRVLLVDQVDSRQAPLIEAIIRSTGHLVEVSEWPINLEDALAQYTPDLLLLGVDLNGVSGFEVCGDLRLTDLGRVVPVVLVAAAHGAKDLVEMGLRAGADDVLRMSMTPGELQARMEVQIRNKRTRDALQELRRERDEMRVAASTDALTGVMNRRALDTNLASEFSKREPFTVLMLDVDHFKGVNDRFGHEVGDVVLREVGAYLRKSMRSGDFCGRYGGEEFVVALHGCTLENAAAIGERHRKAIASIKFPKGRHPDKVTVSIGVAIFDPEHADTDPASLLHRADTALYKAKRTGRNRVVVAPAVKAAREPDKPAALCPSHARITLDSKKAPRTTETLEAALVRQLNAGRAALPTMTAVAVEALRRSRDGKTSIAPLARILERDPHVTARFLAVANSVLYRGTVPVNSMRAALVRVGMEEARDLLSRMTQTEPMPKYQDEAVCIAERAQLAGRAGRAICKVLRWPYEFDYLIGLLHDLGEARVLRILASLPDPIQGPTMVQELIARYHTRAGAQLAETWHLPSEIIEACAHHHDKSRSKTSSVRLAMLTDVFSRAVTRSDPDDAVAWRELGLSDAQAEIVLTELRTPSPTEQ
jgi:diguanylate cyclase (GGDEF)-like protein